MTLQESGEMYLETIYVLTRKNDCIRSLDVAMHMNYSKPSVSRAVGLLKRGGFLTVNAEGFLFLTEEGIKIAEKTYERHVLLTEFFTRIGVPEDIATEDACRIEHVISDTTFDAIKKHAHVTSPLT